MDGDIVRRRADDFREENLPLESRAGKPLRFTISLDPDSVTLATMMELSFEGHMAFNTEEGREAFFARCEMDPRYADYWTALSHARSTNLGIWGSDERLYEDCTRIMAYELKRTQMELGIRADVTTEDVRRSHLFREAYRIMRYPKEAAMHNFVRALDDNRRHMEYMRIESDDLPQRLGYLHIDMLIELGRVRVTKELLRETPRLPCPRDLLNPGSTDRPY